MSCLVVIAGRKRPLAWARCRVVLLALVTLSAIVPGPLVAAQPVPGATPAPGHPPITFPRDEGPHDVATEWWYYTGHLATADGRRYGFEMVFFHGHKGLATGYAAHVALTDDSRRTFAYDQRRVGLAGVAHPAAGFDLGIGDWRIRGADGRDSLAASLPGYAIDLSLTAAKPPVLHGRDGYIAYGAGGESAYYSRTRMRVAGTLTAAGISSPVTGDAWMDHEWGDFSVFALGGWEWFSVQLADGRDLMLYLVRDKAGRLALAAGTLVAANGAATHLDPHDFTVTSASTWTSPRTGITYPSRWRIRLPPAQLDLTLTPTLAAQELDTRRSTGVVYWEGEVTAAGLDGAALARGLGYVELAGFGT